MTDRPTILTAGPTCAPITLILAHGASAPMDTPFMEKISSGLAAAGIQVLRFEFPYMIRRRQDDKRLRIEHLRTLTTPTLILQGERDPLGNQAEVGTFPLAESVRVHWLADGDHDLTPRKRSGRAADQNLNEAIDEIAGFLAD